MSEPIGNPDYRITMAGVSQPIYRVVELFDGEIKAKITAGMPWQGNEQIPWNEKKRIYDSFDQAQRYQNRLIKQGRHAVILRFVFEEVIHGA